MSATYKTLGQLAPGAQSLSPLYIPALTATSGAIVASVLVCNRGSSDTLFRLSIAQQNASDSPEQYLYFDHPIRANRTFVATLGLTLSSGDVLRCYAANSSLSFTVVGVELA